jgi:UDP-glucose 4-epimerase
MKKIAVVTGGCGFIGSHMVDLLVQKNYRVHVIDNLVGGRIQNISHHAKNADVVFESIDIRQLQEDHKLFKDASYVFHFAGIGDIVPSIDKPSEYMEVNVQGTVKVLEASRKAQVKKIVYAASSSCYGLADVPTDENHHIKPEYPYALSKFQGEQACLHWHKVYNLPVVSIRIFNAYGTRSRTSGAYGAVFGVFLKQKLAGYPFTVVGDGNQKRDFLYVTDVVRAFYMSAINEDVIGEIFNLGAGNPQSVNKLVILLGGKVVYIPKRPREPDCTWADITKISKALNWAPQVSFEDGVEEILKNINYWQEAPLWTPEKIEQATKLWFKSFS